jgi:hypothetical protein
VVSVSDDERIGEILIKLTKISEVLKGDDEFGTDGGLIGRIKQHDDRLTILEKFKDRTVFIVGTLLIPAVPGLITLFNLVKDWVKK